MDTSSSLTMRQQSLEILTNGYPQAFKDFFELTHTLPTEGLANGGPYGEAELLPTISLALLRRCLVAAEEETRTGAMGSVYLAYRELAEHFEASEQQLPAIEYYCRCLEIARNANHQGLQIEAYERLGCAHEQHADLLQAIAFFEKQAALSESAPDIQRATTHLREVYWKRAEQLEKAQDYPGAISDFQQVVRAAQTLGDVRWEGQACYRLGLVYAHTASPATALPHLHMYREICQRDGDKVGEGQACCALAEDYQAMGDTGEALAHLEAFLAVADSADATLQARACCSLGIIYSQQEDLNRSLAYFEKFFTLASTTSDRTMVDAARTHLGRARARVNMSTYIETVEKSETDAQSLLGWKLDRLPLQTAVPSG